MTTQLSDDEINGVMIAVNTILERSWTPEGMERWWDRRRSSLGDRTPREVVAEDPSAVVEIAVDGMMMGAT